jgi:RimJ/RimL family protein N-acetyltransferase
MSSQPTLETERLPLRPFVPSDAPAVQRLAGDREIAATTTNVPHPYEDGMAEQWIASHAERFANGTLAAFAIVVREGNILVGAISLRIEGKHARAELVYWLGKEYWNHGYCTEAAREIVRYGFEALGLNRIHASHFARNPASGRVMQKIGMTREGCLRQHVRKWDAFEDLVVYGIVRSDADCAGAYSSSRARSSAS